MNIHRTRAEWEDYAKEAGFEDMTTMLHHWYVVHHKSTRAIANIMNISKDRVAQLLREHGVKLRPRGGAH